MTEKQCEIEWVEKPNTTDQSKILREYQRHLLGTAFEALNLTEYQQYALKTYMKASADGSTGAQMAPKLPGWPVSWLCNMRKAKRLMGSLQKDMKSKRNPQARAIAQAKAFEITSVPPVQAYSLSDAVKLKCTGLTLNGIKRRGVTETQVRKMRIVIQMIEVKEPFGNIAAKVRVPEAEIRLIAKILKEAEQLKV